ncbi:CBS domain-containing protein [Desulfocurvibacter africanus PCS]|uniref:CBS domain-containing protein n=1 Tax=Desulfocurvibacter africanus PCS TaxID=1262666 RepID=M5PRZ2_DESAF|nr:hemolysin family protein [Desulfocurvibacter africanus]EMG36899.1 CBS domain-containing protein [Desulfocurvibacter africanus PCS]
MTRVLLEIGAILLLILFNGFLAMSEMAVVAAMKIRLESRARDGARGARFALRLKEQPERFLSTVQIGITLVGVLTGAFGGATLAERLELWLTDFPALAPYAGGLAIALVVTPVTYLTLVLGELAPKRLAFGAPERVAAFCAPLMILLMRLSLPAVKLLSGSTALVVRLLGQSQHMEPRVTEEDVRGMAGEAVKAGAIEHGERDMLERIFRLGDRQVEAIMIHRAKIEWIDLDDPYEENVRKVMTSPFSRFPVAREELSEAVGVIKAKDFLAIYADDRRVSFTDPRFLHQPIYVPETTRVLALLERFKQEERMHFAMVLDEYGDIRGIVTLNDILEAIVGDIPGADQMSEPGAVRREDGSWLLDGLMPMDEVVSLLGIPPSLMAHMNGQFQTLAGFILHHLGRIPQTGDVLVWHELRFEVVDMDGNRIDKVLAQAQPEKESEE